MAVSRVGTTVGPYWSGNSGSLSWPAGSAVGHLAVLHAYGTPSSKRQVDGWSSYKHTPSSDHWWKVLTASDIASALPIVKGYAASLSVYSGAGRIGAVSDLGSQNPGVTTTVAGSMVEVSGRGRKALTPSGAVGADQVLAVYDGRHCNVWVLGPQAVPGWVGLTGFNGTDSTSVEIVPIAGPSAPTITGPSNGSVLSAAAAAVLSWIHRSAQTGTQDGYSVRVVEDGTTTYYLTSGGTLTGSITTIASSSATATVAAGQLVSGSSYAISIQTSEGGVWSAWSSVTVSAITPPTVTGVTVSSPAGSLMPTVSWTGSTTGGQQAYRVRILPATATSADDSSVLWDSQATALSDASVTVPPLSTWVNGQSLKAWVQIQQPGLWSAWVASSAFTVSWTPPAAPSSVVAANQAAGPLLVTVAGVAGAASVEVAWANPVADNLPTWVGAVSAWGETATLPAACTDGDLVVVVAVDWSSTTPPTPPAGWRTLATDASLWGVTLACQPAAGSGLGTWVGPLLLEVGVWRGVAVGAAAVTVSATDAAPTPGLSVGTGSWVGTAGLNGDAIPAAPAGTVSRAALGITRWADSNGPVASWPGSATAGQGLAVSVELTPTNDTTWARLELLTPAGASVVVADPAATYAVPRRFRARASQVLDGIELWSGWTVSPAPVASTDMGGYLIGDDGTYRAVRIRNDEAPEREEQITAHYGLDADFARVDRGKPQGWSGVTTILTDTRMERLDLIGWLDAHPVWVWRWPPERDGAVYADAGSIRVTRDEAFKPARLAQVAISQRDLPIGWIEQP